MIDLSGKTALVTGASRGIGRASALKLAEAGANVIVNYVSNQSAAKEVADQIASLGRLSASVKADVSEPEDIASMLDFVAREFEQLDILVSNAASGGFRNLLDASPRNFEAAMNTNVRALMLLVQSAMPLMREGKDRRKVIALSSHGSHRALPAYGLIGASKAALESLVRHLAIELGDVGINVNVVLAGLVATDSTKGFPGSEQAFQEMARRRCVGELQLTPERVAETVLFLASSPKRSRTGPDNSSRWRRIAPWLTDRIK